jgi:hypothetical protein
MTPEEFASHMEQVAGHLGHPMDREAKGLLRRLLERYRNDWNSERKETVISKIRLGVIRAVLYARARSGGSGKGAAGVDARCLTLGYSDAEGVDIPPASPKAPPSPPPRAADGAKEVAPISK